MKFIYFFLSLTSLFSLQLNAQPACVNYTCDITNLDWLQEKKDYILDPIQNPPMGGCAPSQIIQQADYNGQAVIIVRPGSCLIADEPSNVFDCAGNYLFSFGGFCITPDNSPCPGDIQAQELMNLETIFDIPNGDYQSCSISSIPTLGEWGLISLSLLLLIFGINSLREKNLALNFNSN